MTRQRRVASSSPARPMIFSIARTSATTFSSYATQRLSAGVRWAVQRFGSEGGLRPSVPEESRWGLAAMMGGYRGDILNLLAEALGDKVFPSTLHEQLDMVRHLGNYGAHPIVDKTSGLNLDVESGELDALPCSRQPRWWHSAAEHLGGERREAGRLSSTVRDFRIPGTSVSGVSGSSNGRRLTLEALAFVATLVVLACRTPGPPVSSGSTSTEAPTATTTATNRHSSEELFEATRRAVRRFPIDGIQMGPRATDAATGPVAVIHISKRQPHQAPDDDEGMWIEISDGNCVAAESGPQNDADGPADDELRKRVGQYLVSIRSFDSMMPRSGPGSERRIAQQLPPSMLLEAVADELRALPSPRLPRRQCP